MNRLIQNNNINIHVAYTGKTHENNCININTKHELTNNWQLSLIKRIPTAYRPSKVIPTLEHISQNNQYWITPELVLKIHLEKGILNHAKVS
jgi:hypothetical protein